MPDSILNEQTLLALLAALAPDDIPDWFQPEFPGRPKNPVSDLPDEHEDWAIALEEWENRREKWRFLRWRAWFAQNMRGCAAAAATNTDFERAPLSREWDLWGDQS